MRSAIFLSVRDKSKRLPGKITSPICGRRAIEHLVDRIKCARHPDLIVMTTSTNPNDAGLVDIAKQEGIEVFCGSEDDKLLRYLDAAKKFDVDFCVVVDGDDILADPIMIDNIISAFIKTEADYIVVDDLPLGVTGFGVKIDALRKVVESKSESDTEIWGGYFTTDVRFSTLTLSPPAAWRHPEWRMTLDYPEDLEFFTRIFQELYIPGSVFSFDEVVGLLERRPDISAINQVVKEKYEAHLNTYRFKA